MVLSSGNNSSQKIPFHRDASEFLSYNNKVILPPCTNLNVMRLYDVPIGSRICHLDPSLMEPLCHSGLTAELIQKREGIATLRLPSGQTRSCNIYMNAAIVNQFSAISSTTSSMHVPKLHRNSQCVQPEIYFSRKGFSISWKQIAKIVAMVGLLIIGFALIDDILNRRIYNPFPSIDDFFPRKIKVPCQITVTPEKLTKYGDCTIEELDLAYIEREKLLHIQYEEIRKEEARIRLEEEKIIKENTRKEIEESHRRIDEIGKDSTKKLNEHLEESRKTKERDEEYERQAPQREKESVERAQQYIRETQERWAKFEEDQEKKRIEQRDCRRVEQEQEFLREVEELPTCLPKIANLKNRDKYLKLSNFDRASHKDLNPNCYQHAAVILGYKTFYRYDCDEVFNEHRKLKIEVHPDKNLNEQEKANQAFQNVNVAYTTLCQS